MQSMLDRAVGRRPQRPDRGVPAAVHAARRRPVRHRRAPVPAEPVRGRRAGQRQAAGRRRPSCSWTANGSRPSTACGTGATTGTGTPPVRPCHSPRCPPWPGPPRPALAADRVSPPAASSSTWTTRSGDGVVGEEGMRGWASPRHRGARRSRRSRNISCTGPAGGRCSPSPPRRRRTSPSEAMPRCTRGCGSGRRLRRLAWQTGDAKPEQLRRARRPGSASAWKALMFADDNPAESPRSGGFPAVDAVDRRRTRPTRRRPRAADLESGALTAGTARNVIRRASAAGELRDRRGRWTTSGAPWRCGRRARVDETVLPRVAQLLQKTNQFNLTTRRRTAAGGRGAGRRSALGSAGGCRCGTGSPTTGSSALGLRRARAATRRWSTRCC